MKARDFTEVLELTYESFIAKAEEFKETDVIYNIFIALICAISNCFCLETLTYH